MAINSLSASSHGLSGLASGIDTQQMVEAMLANTQGKIDATSQKKSQLTSKQGLYREITTKLLAFQNSFFKYGTSDTNLMSPSFFNSMTAKTTSSAFKAIASSTASVGKTTVNYIDKLAQMARSKSKDTVTGELSGKFDVDKMKALTESKTNEKITFKSDAGAEISFSISELVGGNATPNGTLEMEQILRNKLSGMASVSFENGALSITAKDGKPLTVSGDVSALKMVGLTQSRTSGEDGKLALSLNPAAALPSMEVTVNGIKKSITVNPVGVSTAGELATRMQDTLQKAFGSKVQVTETGGKIKFWMKNATGGEDLSSQITLVGGADNGGSELMKTFGISSGKSNKIGTGMSLAEANFKEPILGGVQKFTINGVGFSFDSGTAIFEVLEEVNSSDAGVTISYQATEDKFVIESKVSGELTGEPFEMSQTQGNLLTAMFGVGRSGSLSTKGMVGTGSITGTEFTAADITFEDRTVKLNVDGVDYDIQVKFKASDTKNTATFIARLNEAIKTHEMPAGTTPLKDKVSFGYEDASGKVKLSMAGANGVEVQVKDGLTDLGLNAGDRTYTGTAKAGTSMTALGFKAGTDGLKVTIGSITVSLEAEDTVEGFRAKLDAAVKATVTDRGGIAATAGAEFDTNTGRYRMFGVDIPTAPPPVTMKVENDNGALIGTNETVEINKTADAGLFKAQEGQNAVLSINGVEIERSSNSFTMDGITYDLLNTTPKGTDGKPIAANEVIEVTRDTDKIYDGITKFVEEYNKLVDAINGQLNAEPTYRDYPPLTDKQKEAMSDREVELWEKKAQGGLLRNDSTLEMVMSGLRKTLYTKPAGGMALYELGIQPNSFYGEQDHLTIDDPAAVKQRIAENPTMVQALFADAQEGLSQLLDQTITRSASTNPGSPGILVRAAGATGRVDTTSTIYKEVRELNKRLDSLKRTYESEHARYWKQFNSMEQMISQMNQQSSWLTQQFS